jgi:hypothetical protein
MRLFLVNFAAISAIAFLQIDCQAGDDALKDKIVRATLNHNEPALIKVSTNGVTSLEFPYKIEALDGYGFSQTPGAGDAFQISYTKGTNYFSVRALKPGVTGNLTVVLDQKVYAIYFEESSNPSFVNVFSAANDGGLAAVGERGVPQNDKIATPAQLAGLLDKAKNYALLKSTSPQMLEGMRVVEPEKKGKIEGQVETRIVRVLQDESLDAVTFEIEVNNRSAKDFLYEPQELRIKVKDKTYGAAMEDAPGIVQAGTSASIFLLVNDASLAEQKDSAAGNDFDLVIKQDLEPKSEGLAFNQPPGDYLPTKTNIEQFGRGPEVNLVANQGADQEPQSTSLPGKHASPKKVTKKADPKPERSVKENVAKTQKPPAKKLFGWL